MSTLGTYTATDLETSYIPDVYVTIMAEYLANAFDDQLGQHVTVVPRLPQPSDPNCTIFIQFHSVEAGEYEINSRGPMTLEHHGEINLLTKHVQEHEGRAFNRRINTNLRHFLVYSGEHLEQRLGQPRDQLPGGGEERFMKFRFHRQELHTPLKMSSEMVFVSTTEFKITTETAC